MKTTSRTDSFLRCRMERHPSMQANSAGLSCWGAITASMKCCRGSRTSGRCCKMPSDVTFQFSGIVWRADACARHGSESLPQYLSQYRLEPDMDHATCTTVDGVAKTGDDLQLALRYV